MIKLLDIIREIGEKTVQPHRYSWKSKIPSKLFKTIQGSDGPIAWMDASEYYFVWDTNVESKGKPVKMFAGIALDRTFKEDGLIRLVGLEVSFGVYNKGQVGDLGLVGGGELYRTLSTVIHGISDFYDAFQDQIAYFSFEADAVVKFDGESDGGAKRMRLYKAYVERLPSIRKNFDVVMKGPNKLYLVNKNIPEEYKDLVQI